MMTKYREIIRLSSLKFSNETLHLAVVFPEIPYQRFFKRPGK